MSATVALARWAVFGVLGFGWRSWLQRRRTGSAGFRGMHGRIGSVEWVAGVGFVVGLAVAVVAPVLQLCGVVALTFGLGITLVAIGAFVLLVAIMKVQVRRIEEP